VRKYGKFTFKVVLVYGGLGEAVEMFLVIREFWNESLEIELFRLNGLRSGGFDIRSLRVKNDGEIRFNYKILSNVVGGDLELYENLKIKIYRNWDLLYEGYLSAMLVNVPDNLEVDDLILVLSLDSEDVSLVNKNSHFDLIIETIKDGEFGGFVVKQKLNNSVSTGYWD
jgi:hypothetical protein